MKMNIGRAEELIAPLKNGTANDISPAWTARLIEALEYVIEHDSEDYQAMRKIAIENKLIAEQFQKLLGVYTTTDALAKVVELMQPELTQKQEPPK
jgi:hypothetical protein